VLGESLLMNIHSCLFTFKIQCAATHQRHAERTGDVEKWRIAKLFLFV